jgi:hypothetical protein
MAPQGKLGIKAAGGWRLIGSSFGGLFAPDCECGEEGGICAHSPRHSGPLSGVATGFFASPKYAGI